MSFVILKIKNPRIIMESIEISSPLNGRNERKATPIPNAGRIPIPQAAQPGTKIPRKIPIVPKVPTFWEIDFNFFVLYAINTNKIPKRKLIVTKVIKELNIKTLFVLNAILRKNIRVFKNPMSFT